MMRCPVALLILLLPGFAQGQGWDDRVAARQSEIEAWQPLGGIWTGEYRMVEAPEAVFEQTRKMGLEGYSVGVKINFLAGDTPTLEFRFPEQTAFADIGGAVSYFENTLGWTIAYERLGEVWIERYVFMFNRLEEHRAEMTVARTVHNWVDDGDDTDGTVEYFYVFSRGEVTRSRRSTRARPPD